jgi:hypothetical protein
MMLLKIQMPLFIEWAERLVLAKREVHFFIYLQVRIVI